MDSLYFQRRITKKQYENKKINLAIGLSLINKENIQLDIGISAKRNPDIKKINLGTGISAKFFFLNFGAYLYKDDQKVDISNQTNPFTATPYSTIYNSNTYQENFSVMTFTAGTKIGNLSLDTGIIRTKYKFYPDPTVITLYSASYAWKKFLFNAAQRKESSSNGAFANNAIILVKEKKEIYYGVQFLLNKHMLLGVAYNNFLLHELSGTLTLFF
jgi:hypothetical protein